MGTADAKLAGHMSAIPAYMSLWLPFVRGAVCARQDRTSLFERGLPVLPNLQVTCRLQPAYILLWLPFL